MKAEPALRVFNYDLLDLSNTCSLTFSHQFSKDLHTRDHKKSCQNDDDLGKIMQVTAKQTTNHKTKNFQQCFFWPVLLCLLLSSRNKLNQ